MANAIVAIVGRPNVGKSALFNRIVGHRIAIVEGEPGITRDRHLCPERVDGEKVHPRSTPAGSTTGRRTVSSRSARQQAERAMEEADVLLFVVDARSGLFPADEEVAEAFAGRESPSSSWSTRSTTRASPMRRSEFFALGLGDPIPVSAEHGRGVGDLLDRITALLPDERHEEERGDEIRVAVIGRPNVGKSSLVNRLLGEERSIVTDIPGTTRGRDRLH